MVMSPGTATSRSAVRLLTTPGWSTLVADFAAEEEAPAVVGAEGRGGAGAASAGACVSDCGSDLATALGGVDELTALAVVIVLWQNGCH